MTRQRRVILDELRRAEVHPTADELYARVRRRLPHISLATVYRNLDVLSEAGEARKIELAGQQRRYDGCTEPHQHVRCLRCGRIDDVAATPMPTLLRRVHDELGYEIVDFRLEFVGICPACRDSDNDGEGGT
jgi:Fur family ferric uptake transcriptional regulator